MELINIRAFGLIIDWISNKAKISLIDLILCRSQNAEIVIFFLLKSENVEDWEGFSL